jgi:hypothetical protein
MMSTPSTAVDRPAERPPALPAAMPPGAMGEDVINELWRQAKALAVGGMFKGVTQAEQAFAKMVVGHHLGLNPSQSMMGIDIVEGNAQLRGVLMGTLVRERDGYDWKVLEFTNEKCQIEFFRNGESQGVSEWNEADSQRAELNKDRSNHKKYPRAMYWNRAMSQGVKLLVPETMRGIPVYVAEDFEAGGARDGEVGGSGALPAATDAELEKAVRDYLPEAHVDEALALMLEMNAVAANSWTTAKVQMVFSGKESERAIKREFEMIRRAIDEIAERRRVTGDPVPAADAEAESEDVVDAVVVPEAGGEDAEPVAAAAADAPSEDELKEAERVRVRRVEHLQQSLENPEVNEQQRSDIEAELDLLTSDPPESAAGEDDIKF